jgi:hypothetical protein
MTTTIHLSGPADVLAVLPYQLGFHPRDCLVVMSLVDAHMGLVQRIDLPPLEHVADAVAALIAPLRQDRPRAVLLIGFEEREGQSRAVLDEMTEVCRAEGVEVAERMVVRQGRWFSPDCYLGCCPPEGLTLPTPGEVPAVAEFVGRGICPLPDRAALAARLELGSPLLGRAASAQADKWSLSRREATEDTEDTDAREAALDRCRAKELAVWSRVLSDDDDAEPISALTSQDLGLLAVSLTDVDLRDGLIAWLCPGAMPRDLIDPRLLGLLSGALPATPRLDGEAEEAGEAGEAQRALRPERIERRLRELCAALPDVWAVSALTVLASFAWWRGDGALTRIALARALRVDPRYRLARLLERMVDLAIRPESASA